MIRCVCAQLANLPSLSEADCERLLADDASSLSGSGARERLYVAHSMSSCLQR